MMLLPHLSPGRRPLEAASEDAGNIEKTIDKSSSLRWRLSINKNLRESQIQPSMHNDSPFAVNLYIQLLTGAVAAVIIYGTHTVLEFTAKARTEIKDYLPNSDLVWLAATILVGGFWTIAGLLIITIQHAEQQIISFVQIAIFTAPLTYLMASLALARMDSNADYTLASFVVVLVLWSYFNFCSLETARTIRRMIPSLSSCGILLFLCVWILMMCLLLPIMIWRLALWGIKSCQDFFPLTGEYEDFLLNGDYYKPCTLFLSLFAIWSVRPERAQRH